MILPVTDTRGSGGRSSVERGGRSGWEMLEHSWNQHNDVSVIRHTETLIQTVNATHTFSDVTRQAGSKNNFLPHLPKLNNLNGNIFQHKNCLLNVQRPLSEMSVKFLRVKLSKHCSFCLSLANNGLGILFGDNYFWHNFVWCLVGCRNWKFFSV